MSSQKLGRQRAATRTRSWKAYMYKCRCPSKSANSILRQYEVRSSKCLFEDLANTFLDILCSEFMVLMHKAELKEFAAFYIGRSASRIARVPASKQVFINLIKSVTAARHGVEVWGNVDCTVNKVKFLYTHSIDPLPGRKPGSGSDRGSHSRFRLSTSRASGATVWVNTHCTFTLHAGGGGGGGGGGEGGGLVILDTLAALTGLATSWQHVQQSVTSVYRGHPMTVTGKAEPNRRSWFQ